MIILNQSGGTTSALSQLALSLSPGEWGELVVSNQDAVIGRGPTSGSMIHYGNGVAWNPISNSHQSEMSLQVD